MEAGTPGTKEPRRLQSAGPQRVGRTRVPERDWAGPIEEAKVGSLVDGTSPRIGGHSQCSQDF